MEEGLPRAIKGLIPYSYAVLDILTWLVAILLICAAAYWLFKRFRKKPKGQSQEITPADLLKKILEELNHIEVRPPCAQRELEEFYFSLSLAFRSFLELRFKFPAASLTTDEIGGPLRRSVPLSRNSQDEVMKFLKRADMVKYAGAASDLAEAVAAKKMVLAWVQVLLPKTVEVS